MKSELLKALIRVLTEFTHREDDRRIACFTRGDQDLAHAAEQERPLVAKLDAVLVGASTISTARFERGLVVPATKARRPLS